jgi:ATP-binding cassette subfamily C protein CydD
VNIQAQLIQELKREKGAGLLLAGGVAAGAAGGLLILLQARLISLILEQVIFAGASTSDLMPLFSGLTGIVLIRALLAGSGETLAGLGSLKLKMSLRQSLFAKITRLGPAYLSGQDSGQVSAALTDGIEAVETYFNQSLPQAALAAIIPLGIFLFVLPLDTLTGIILLLTAPLIPLFMVLIGKNSEKLTRRQWSALSRMSAFFLDTLQGLQELKILGRSRERGGEIRQVSEQYRNTTLEVMRLTFLSALALEWVSTLSTAVIAVQIGLRLLAGGLPFEQAFFILVIAPDFYLPLRNLGLRFHAGMAGISAARKIYEILNRQEPHAAVSKNMAARALSDGVEIEFQNVSYTYPGREESAIREISLKIEPGGFHALAGRNGAGKSTLAALLLRIITPDAGQILVNGRPLDEIPLGDWQKTIAWVPQRPYLFHASLADNIRLGRPEAGMAEVERAAELARLERFIEQLPRGYATIIGEKGARLSGGQAQRLAIARAFLMERPVLIMDEPTAALDLQLELDLNDVLRELTRGRTTLLIAHRTSSLQSAGRIIFLENGWMAEEGTYHNLIDKKGRFYSLIQRGGQNLQPPKTGGEAEKK